MYVSIALMFHDRGVTARSRSRQMLHDFMKIVWPQAYE